MKLYVKRLSIVSAVVMAVAVMGVGHNVQAQNAPADPKKEAAADDTQDAQKLLRWTTLEQAFLKTNRNRLVLRTYIDRLQKQLDETEGDEQKQEIRKKLGDARKRLYRINTAMDVVFGVKGDPEYIYNPVQSTVYVRAGTVTDIFERVVRLRDQLRGYIADQKGKLDATKDEQQKKKIQENLDNAVSRYQTVAAALQTVFGITPERDFSYNPDNATLYLKVSDEELAELKQRLAEQREETQGETGDANPDKK